MRVLCINGSPRKKSNTAKIMAAFQEVAEEFGAKVKKATLGKLDYQGCVACGACKRNAEECVLKDDISPVLRKMARADIVVLGSPIYYGDLTSQMKAFVDRTYAFLTPDYKSRLNPGKTLVMILPQGDPEPAHFADVFPRYHEFFKWHGFARGISIRACGADAPDGAALTAAIAEARALAEKLLSGDPEK